MGEFFKFPSIESFSSAVKLGQKYNKDMLFTIKPKLHGTNSAVFIPSKNSSDNIHYQSRNRIITPDDDNLGFANFMSSQCQVFRSDKDLVVYG